MHEFHKSYTNVRNESWNKHFEENMWNVSFVQYLSVPAFTEWFGLVSIQFQISSGYLLNFHLGWQVVLMSCAKIYILMKGLRRKYLAVWWGRNFQALNETPRRAEKGRGKFPLCIYACGDEDYRLVLATELSTVAGSNIWGLLHSNPEVKTRVRTGLFVQVELVVLGYDHKAPCEGWASWFSYVAELFADQ